jgi:hypothetical protein
VSDVDDPRRAAFAKVSVRAEPASPANPADPALRAVGGSPPPKPAPVALPPEPDDERPADPAPESASLPGPASPETGTPRPAGRPPRARGAAKTDSERRHIGTRRGNLVYIQTQITPALSARLDQAAEEQDVVLGEVLMASVRAFRPDSTDSHPRRRRRGGNPVRRDIGVLPTEAAQVLDASTAAGLTVSAFLRQALERHLG